MAHHHVQHARNVGHNLFMHNENSAYIMSCVTARAVMSCMHCVAHARRQAGRPMHTWHARNYLWTCHSCKLNDIYKKTASHFSTLNTKIANQIMLKRILIAMHNENKTDCNENFRICAEEPIAPLYKQ